jgi:hypothetical protein
LATVSKYVAASLLAREHARVIRRQAIVGSTKRFFFASGNSGSDALRISSIQACLEHQRQQIRVREVAIIVRVFLRAHRARLALVGIEQARLLIDLAAALENFDLAARFVLDRLHA